MADFAGLADRVASLFGRKRKRRVEITLPAVLVCLAAGLAAVLLGPWKAAALVVGLTVAFLAVVRPTWVVMLLALYIPFEPFLLKFMSDDIYVFARYFSESLIYLLAAVVLVRAFRSRRGLLTTPIDLPLAFFVLTALASLAINAVPAVYGLLGLRQILRFVVLFFVVVYLEPEREFIRRLTWALFAVVAFQGLLGLAQSVVGAPLDEFLIPSERRFYESIQLTSGTEQFWSPGARVFATMGRFDQLGTFLGFFMLIAVGLLYQAKDELVRRKLFAVLLLAAPAFVLTLSRASWFGLALGLLLVGGWLMRDNRVRMAFAGLVMLAVSYLMYSGIVVRYMVDYPEQTAVERFFEAFSYERWRGEYYGLGRLYWMVQTVSVVVPAAPVLGHGPGTYGGGAAAALGNATVYQRLNLPFGVYGTEGYIDNNWFSLWGETGTLGLVLYVWMFLALSALCYRVFRRSRDPLARGLALGMMGCLLAVSFQAMLATYLEVRTLALYLWLYAAFIVVMARREKLLFRR